MAGSRFSSDRRRLCEAMAAAAATMALGIAPDIVAQPASQAYPARPVRLVVPFPPGGATDIVARLVAKHLSDTFGQSVVVENRPGAGAIIGADHVAKSAPDGYTLFMGSPSSLTINPSLYATLPYNPAVDFIAISVVANTPGVLAVNPNVPVKTVRELIELARSKPGKMTYASSGNGNFQHLVAEMFKGKTGIDVLHIPYKGSAPALVDAVSGQVDMIFDVVPSAAPLINSGKLRGLAVTTLQRSEQLPDLPSLNELGFTGFDASSWYALVAPSGTPIPIIERLSAEVGKMVRTPEARAALLKVGASPVGSSPRETAGFVADEAARWGTLIRANGIKPD